MKNYEYHSQLAPYISGLIRQKRIAAIAMNTKRIYLNTLTGSVSKTDMIMAACQEIW